MHDGELVLAKELGTLLGYSKQMLCHLTQTGVIAAPRMVIGADRRWRRAWPRDYIEALRKNPPPQIAKRLRPCAESSEGPGTSCERRLAD